MLSTRDTFRELLNTVKSSLIKVRLFWTQSTQSFFAKFTMC